MGILIPLILILFTCLFIWRACDGFEVASEYVGRNLSDGVRGGTINAIASSLPELLTTLIALMVFSDTDGFAVGIGTTAGSALFNGMIIPAVCILAVVGTIQLGKNIEAVKVNRKVILRDGLALIFCEAILVLSISGDSLYWWHGFLLMALYCGYLIYTLKSMGVASHDSDDSDDDDEEEEDDDDVRGWVANVFYWLSLGPLLDLEGLFIKEKQKQQIKAETWNGWPLLLTSTAVIGLACWLLVHACGWLGAKNGYSFLGSQFEGLGMPTMFVAVIFASMATSVPDTIISIKDAKSGNYDDAVANALGSNIFDICFALGFPLFCYTLYTGSPIRMDQEVVEQSGELRLLLLLLTCVGFCIYYFGKREVLGDGKVLIWMGKKKAWSLLCIYGAFVAYIVGLGAGSEWAQAVSDAIRSVSNSLPTIP